KSTTTTCGRACGSRCPASRASTTRSIGSWRSASGTSTARSSRSGLSSAKWGRSMTERMRRVNESLRAVLAEAGGELKDPRIGCVTVTGVRRARGLRHAVVFLRVRGYERKRTKTLAGLEAAHGVLQSRLARELRLKRTPQLTFQYDPSVEQGVRMSKLTDEL